MEVYWSQQLGLKGQRRLHTDWPGGVYLAEFPVIQTAHA